jgi:hypothetical protein
MNIALFVILLAVGFITIILGIILIAGDVAFMGFFLILLGMGSIGAIPGLEVVKRMGVGRKIGLVREEEELFSKAFLKRLEYVSSALNRTLEPNAHGAWELLRFDMQMTPWFEEIRNFYPTQLTFVREHKIFVAELEPLMSSKSGKKIHTFSVLSLYGDDNTAGRWLDNYTYPVSFRSFIHQEIPLLAAAGVFKKPAGISLKTAETLAKLGGPQQVLPS